MLPSDWAVFNKQEQALAQAGVPTSNLPVAAPAITNPTPETVQQQTTQSLQALQAAQGQVWQQSAAAAQALIGAQNLPSGNLPTTGTGIDWTTVLLIGGGLFLAVFLLR